MGAAAGMLLIAFAFVRIVGHVVDLPLVFSMLAPLIFALAAGVLLAVDIVDRASGCLVGRRSWLAAVVPDYDFLTRALRAATPPPRPAGA